MHFLLKNKPRNEWIVVGGGYGAVYVCLIRPTLLVVEDVVDSDPEASFIVGETYAPAALAEGILQAFAQLLASIGHGRIVEVTAQDDTFVPVLLSEAAQSVGLCSAEDGACGQLASYLPAAFLHLAIFWIVEVGHVVLLDAVLQPVTLQVVVHEDDFLVLYEQPVPFASVALGAVGVPQGLVGYGIHVEDVKACEQHHTQIGVAVIASLFHFGVEGVDHCPRGSGLLHADDVGITFQEILYCHPFSLLLIFPQTAVVVTVPGEHLDGMGRNVLGEVQRAVVEDEPHDGQESCQGNPCTAIVDYEPCRDEEQVYEEEDGEEQSQEREARKVLGVQPTTGAHRPKHQGTEEVEHQDVDAYELQKTLHQYPLL